MANKKEQQARKQAAITVERLHLLLEADFDNGKLYWKFRPREHCKSDRHFHQFNSRCAGQEAFTSFQTAGYPFGTIEGHYFTAHRVLFAMYHNRWPGEIDHIDGDRTNNRITNLREVTRSENMTNRKAFASSKTGLLNIHPYNNNGIYVCLAALGVKRVFGANQIEEAVEFRDKVRAENGYSPARDAKKPTIH
ncbi:HNH endonuclease signature motif containing protein [Paracoccus sp. SSK6]|uniref:HNH endonuclease signature motif containing protein n=1 Tax=Paracoccus sp. SSK6 TaxID=3143131 RepID=UPI003219E164